jgi:nuclear pore complex protein Nup53
VESLYVVVFGYPADRYGATAEFFRSLGEHATEPEPHAEIANCFRIGFRAPTDALRAVRKSGEVLGGSFMVGVKWAVRRDDVGVMVSAHRWLSAKDMAHAESLLGPELVYGYGGGSLPTLPTPGLGDAAPMDEDVPPTPGMSALVPMVAVGTPMHIAPPSAAFRVGGAPKPSVTPTAGPAFAPAAGATNAATPGKGMLGQVSDLIFGWWATTRRSAVVSSTTVFGPHIPAAE